MKRLCRVRDMEVNLVKRTVTLAGKDVKLTAKEFDLLQMIYPEPRQGVQP